AEGWDTHVLEDLARFKALVIGPGLGRTDATGRSVRRVIADAPLPIVVDADGLYALGDTGGAAEAVGARRGRATVMTPHDGELSRLMGRKVGADRIGAAREAAATTGATVLLKGSTTVVADPDGATFV